MATLPKINDYGLLRERIYQILKTYIIEGDLKEDTKITEAELSKQLGVSKTPVREAISRLVVEGLITLHPNKRMTITKIFSKDIIEVYQLRKCLCGLAATLVASKITEEDITKFKEIIREMELFVEKGNVKEYSKSADIFHGLMQHLSGNRRLETFSINLHEQVYRYRIKSLKVKGRIEKSLSEHKKIIEAIIRHDPEQAKKFCEEHLDNALENILRNTINEKQ
jgi:DNA-binding GntR family transcriptional regulator